MLSVQIKSARQIEIKVNTGTIASVDFGEPHQIVIFQFSGILVSLTKALQLLNHVTYLLCVLELSHLIQLVMDAFDAFGEKLRICSHITTFSFLLLIFTNFLKMLTLLKQFTTKHPHSYLVNIRFGVRVCYCGFPFLPNWSICFFHHFSHRNSDCS